MNEKILLIEDNADHIALIKAIFESRGFEVFACSNGADAINEFKKYSPDIVLLDLQLPKVNGFEILSAFAEIPVDEKKPIVVVSAYTLREERKRVFSMGASAFVPKPIDTRRLPMIVQKILLKTRKK